ncbi:MAG TPA: TGS domain-containing protein [Thermotogaceae bacterium]|nr:TGS domain-containing protein [Thermotogaceae bacterium]
MKIIFFKEGDILPANLPPEYKRTEEKLKEAKTLEEKIEIIEKLISLLPRHKGTDKLFADLKRRLSKLRNMAEQERKKKTKGYDPYLIEKAGAGQVMLIGPPNSGKSSLLATLTNANPHIADFPFSTVNPCPGMMNFEDIQIQLIDLPPIIESHVDPLMVNAIKRSDGALIVVDSSSDELLDQMDTIIRKLEERKTILSWEKPEELEIGWEWVRSFVVANKMDIENTNERLEILEEFYSAKFPILPFSALKKSGIEKLKQKIFEMLSVVRVYSKPPGKPPDFDKPFILKKGSTVRELAAEIHKDFSEKLRGAKLWNIETKTFIMVDREYELQDKDVIELVI